MVKTLHGINALLALSMVGMVRAEVITKDEAKAAIEPLYVDELPRYGPGTGKVPKDLEPTQRDRDRMAAAEERRAARQARNLRIAMGRSHEKG